MPADGSTVAACFLDLARRSAACNSAMPCEVRVLSVPGDPLPDSSGKYLVVDTSGRPVAFGFESSRAAPDAVARDLRKAMRARDRLGAEAGGAVLMAVADGELDGRSIALYPACEPLASNRLQWVLQRPAVRSWALSWLRAVAAGTTKDPECDDERAARFERPLEHLAALDGLHPLIRRDAASALDRLRSSRWKPRLLLMHGDFWKDNILIRRSDRSSPWSPSDLVVIDWGTSEMEGYALFDLVRIAQSLDVRRAQLGRELASHLEILRCDLIDARGYVLAALGFRALNLEFFPYANFLRMAASCHTTISAVT